MKEAKDEVVAAEEVDGMVAVEDAVKEINLRSATRSVDCMTNILMESLRWTTSG